MLTVWKNHDSVLVQFNWWPELWRESNPWTELHCVQSPPNKCRSAVPAVTCVWGWMATARSAPCNCRGQRQLVFISWCLQTSGIKIFVQFFSWCTHFLVDSVFICTHTYLHPNEVNETTLLQHADSAPQGHRQPVTPLQASRSSSPAFPGQSGLRKVRD